MIVAVVVLEQRFYQTELRIYEKLKIQAHMLNASHSKPNNRNTDYRLMYLGSLSTTFLY